MSMNNSMNDPYDTSTPKYSTAAEIYDELCEVASGEEIRYTELCDKLCKKANGLRLYEETRCIVESRALLTSHEDFIFGLRVNQQLYIQLEQQYKSKVAQLQAAYEEKVRRLMLLAKAQGVILSTDQGLLQEG